ncbi:MAG TPA: flagellar biosynthetic protein FliR [Dyella sp.]|uniref:EscT/YscT/HrcT family type III secretion system export apparatus protein n=1 Tax=Dyella sp. TaxID=1869338 RepID=UPI002C90C339|nr:flagellar biosynthetic protein FliR [Dyella sp.]HTV87280.1 flagellar biosynthetic protein FliR [Dyella sp.]
MNELMGSAVMLALAMTRALCMIVTIPLGGSGPSGRMFVTPLAIAVGLCVCQAYTLPHVPSVALYALALKEAALGVGLGWMVSRLFFVVGAAGALMDQLAGYTMGQLFNPSLGRSTGPIESLYSLLLVMILMTAGGGFYFAKMILATYQVWPIAQWLPAAPTAAFMHTLLTQGLDQLIDFAIQMAMPIMAMLMFADICIALMARYASEFNPLSSSMAIKAFLVSLMLLASLLGQLGYMQHLMRVLTRVR